MDEFERQRELQARLAAAASDIAELAEHNAEFMDALAPGEHEARRRAFAAWQRDVAAVERRNAARLRAGKTSDLEPPPAQPAIA